MDKKERQRINAAINKQAMEAVTEQHGKDIPPGSYDVELPAHLISDVFEPTYVVPGESEPPNWHPLPMDIRVTSGLVEDRLAFTARTASSGYVRFNVRLSELDKRENAKVIQWEHPVCVSRTMATLPDCGWLLPQLLAAREQHQADLWAIIKGAKQ